jgi:hypothetical protein
MANPQENQMSRKTTTYQEAYAELFNPVMGALRGIQLDSRRFHTVAGLLAETCGKAAERIARKK